MFPAPHDALPLPPHPNIAQYRKLAKDLLHISKSDAPAALTAWSEHWVESLIKLSGLTIPPGMPVRLDRWAAQVEDFAREKLAGHDGKPCRLADAQFVLARLHGFESWPKFTRHVEDLTHAASATLKFEAAADAIVGGDADTVRRLLREEPELIRARSSREHRATLLHYVAANGVEGWRQKTPPNIVEIAETLLDEDGEIDATADMYGSSCTTLGLAATSIHPERAGVQIALMSLLLDRGARMDQDNSAGNRHSLVKACLANGRGDAAKFLAARGAPLDLETAAGAGAIDAVRTCFDHNGKLKPGTSEDHFREGFLWACQYGRNRIVEYLIHLGFDVSAQGRDGQTGLHCATIGAQLETVKLLLKHQPPLEVRNSYGGTVLGQAMWCAFNGDSPSSYLPVIEELLLAGAMVEPEMEDELARLLRRRQGHRANR